MDFHECIDKLCVIGAGAAGLVTSKNLKNSGIRFDVIEAAQDVGGLWLYDKPGSPMYKNTHLISPKQAQAFSDFPMPENYPDFPNHRLVLDYLRSYAKHFNLYEHIQFNTSVKRVEKAGEFWDITLSSGQTRRYGGVIIASGYHNSPRYPEYPGKFNGIIIHSQAYKNPEQLRNRRVLVVGAGQSAMDILAESAVNANQTFHSTRRGFICIPKYFLGHPTEILIQKELPFITALPLKKFLKFFLMLVSALLKLQGASPQRCNLPKLDFSKGVVIPNIDHHVYRYYIQGDIKHKTNIKELKENKVLFDDDSEEYIDMIVYATGYSISFPFIEKKLINWREDSSHPHLYLHIFHPRDDNIFVIGMVHPLGSHWHVFDYQSQLITAYLRAKRRDTGRAKKFEETEKAMQMDLCNGLKVYNSQNHPLVIDKLQYIRILKKLIQFLSD